MPKIADDAMSGNRLSPLPESRTRLTRDDQPIGEKLKAGWQKENYEMVNLALLNKGELLIVAFVLLLIHLRQSY